MSGEDILCKDEEFACEFYFLKLLSKNEVKVCRVHVNDVSKIANQLSESIANTSWMRSLDKYSIDAYEETVSETISALIDIFKDASISAAVKSDFGELLVSMSSAKALEILFDHELVPIAELWKPKIRQNEGFDFHTVCPLNHINFGEAKFSSASNPHGAALNQIVSFLDSKKHKRDIQHLRHIIKKDEPLVLLHDNKFGVVAAFSLNSSDSRLVLSNAVEKYFELFDDRGVSQAYLVGVSHD